MPRVIIVEIVRKLPDQVSFAVLPRRWLVERFFAWIGATADWPRTSGHDRFGHRLPLCRSCYTPGSQVGSFRIRFESDSKSRSYEGRWDQRQAAEWRS
jgi:transposase